MRKLDDDALEVQRGATCIRFHRLLSRVDWRKQHRIQPRLLGELRPSLPRGNRRIAPAVPIEGGLVVLTGQGALHVLPSLRHGPRLVPQLEAEDVDEAREGRASRPSLVACHGHGPDGGSTRDSASAKARAPRNGSTERCLVPLLAAGARRWRREGRCCPHHLAVEKQLSRKARQPLGLEGPHAGVPQGIPEGLPDLGPGEGSQGETLRVVPRSQEGRQFRGEAQLRGLLFVLASRAT
mmetsp:Transcript_56798/g.184747  ORF Transcript_56798/g.184747 Transcript_56798/m.184747 type:complete len:238 (-) Transcript_56798:147-860(-)